MIDGLYLQTIDELSEKVNKKVIDFIGLNVNQKGVVEFKIYPMPDSCIDTNYKPSSIEQFILDNNLLRCKCCAYSLFGERSYMALKNKSKDNILRLFNELANIYPYIDQNIDEIKKISSMKVTDDPEQYFSSLHMIGDKSLIEGKSIVNIEWITRKMSNTNNPGNDYKYDDKYYLEFLESLKIQVLSSLCGCVRRHFYDLIVSKKLHFWLVAIDFYSNGNKKYKIYFKCNSNILKAMKDAFIKIALDKQEVIEQVYQFMSFHSELTLYGFAIGFDSNLAISFNYYFTYDE